MKLPFALALLESTTYNGTHVELQNIESLKSKWINPSIFHNDQVTMCFFGLLNLILLVVELIIQSW